jgi:tetratricopeptide (TPR) repeat protein/transcriptional regulator with XRE-family HTH domain
MRDRSRATMSTRGVTTGGISVVARRNVMARRLRLRAGLTQEALAERSGVSVSTIRGLETGTRRNLQLSSLQRLADAMDLSPDERDKLLAAAMGDDADRPHRQRLPGQRDLTGNGPRAGHGDRTGAPQSSASPVPRQLPADVLNFAGREEYLDQLDALLDCARDARRPTVVISAIAGVGGVGKTALALHWAHRAAAHHPDAQLYVNLRGYALDPPMTPADVLPMFLRALGVPQAALPITEDEQATLYRSLLADRRALIVLDNAATETQVRPLLPGSPTCMVLVTSRNDLLGLTALHDAHRLVLDVLPAAEAHTLLTMILGADRVAAEPEAAAQLAQLCGYLPLALRIAAAQLAGERQETIAGYVARLTNGNRLSRLAIGQDRDAAVRASFDLSYRTLDAASARLFRVLGCAPGPECGIPAAAALIDASLEQAAHLLDRLATAHLIESPRPGRYALHDLLRLYASERAQAEDSAEERDSTLRRLFDMYLHTADTATTLAYPTSAPVLPQPAGSADRALHLPDFSQAKSWLDRERPNLVAAMRYAAEHGPTELTWRLAAVLTPYFYGGMYRSDWLEVSELGLQVAQKDANRTAEAAMMHVLHRVHFAFGDYDTALDYGLRGRSLMPLAENPGTEAEICKQFGHTYWLLGRLAESLDNFTRGRDLYRRIGNRVCELVCINGMALSYLDWGRLGAVLEHTSQVLVVHREVGARLCEAAALHIRALALTELGRFHEAIDDGVKALAMYHETGFRYNEASVLSCVAGAYRDTGRYPEALEYGHRALTLATEFNDTRGTSLAHTALAGTHLILGQPDKASQHIDQAVQVADGTGYRRAFVDAMIGLATISRARGEHDKALDQARTALELARQCQFRACVGRSLTVLAEIHLDRGDGETARELAEEARAIHSEVGYHIGE